MRKIRFLILTAVFALVGFSIVSCPGASPSGTAKVPEAAAALGAGIALNTPFDTAALHSDIVITLANVKTVDSWAAADAEAITWLKWKASADAETQDMTADTIGGVTVTATPTGDNKDCISVNIKSVAGAQKVFDGILTEIVIPAGKLTSNAALAVKLGDNGVPVKFVNSGKKVAGAAVVAFANGSTNAEGGRALYSIASAFSDAFVSEVNNATATGGVEVTKWFSGLNNTNIKAFATRIATENKAAQGNAPAEIAKRTIEIVFKSGATAPAAGPIESDLVIENPSSGTKYLPDGVGKVTIADAVKMYVRKPVGGTDGVKATVAITKSADTTNKTIKGATRTALDAELKVTIDGDCVAFDIRKDDDGIEAGLARLINLPLGVKASLKNDISAGDTSFVIALTGKPSDITQAAVDEAVEAHNPWVTDDVGSASDLLTSAITGYVPGANPYDAQTEAYAQYMPMLTGSYNAATNDWTKGLLVVTNPEGDDQLKWAITETPYAVIQDDPEAIRVRVGQAIADTDITITIANGTFEVIEAGQNKIGWFGTAGSDFPSSTDGDTALKAVVKSATTAQSTSITLTISGTPSATFGPKAMKITIPDDMWSGSSNLVVDTNNLAYWEAKAAYARVSEKTITGKINTVLDNQTVVIALNGAKFVAFTEGEQDNRDVKTWFTNLPQGLSATATAHAAAESVEVTISGTPAATSNAPLAITIPANMMTDLATQLAALTSPVTVDANANCKFAISPKATVADKMISGTQNVALETQSVTITLAGAKFLAFTAGEQGNNDVSDWFTNLPQGLSATAAVQAAGSSVVVTIIGTPTETKDAPLAITIPANMMTDLSDTPVALTSDIAVDANDECRFNIAPAN